MAVVRVGYPYVIFCDMATRAINNEKPLLLGRNWDMQRDANMWRDIGIGVPIDGRFRVYCLCFIYTPVFTVGFV